jgi:hypothetical protein
MKLQACGWMLVLLSGPAALMAGTPQLTCPSGTEIWKAQYTDGSEQQACVDPESGMREGPALMLHDNGSIRESSYLHDKPHGKSRLIDRNGVVEIEDEFDDGINVKTSVTPAGLRTMLGYLQTLASMHSMLTTVSIPEDWTIRYEVVATPESEDLRAMACEIFNGPFDNDFVVQLRHVDADGKLLREQRFNRKVCRAAH